MTRCEEADHRAKWYFKGPNRGQILFCIGFPDEVGREIDDERKLKGDMLHVALNESYDDLGICGDLIIELPSKNKSRPEAEAG